MLIWTNLRKSKWESDCLRVFITLLNVRGRLRHVLREKRREAEIEWKGEKIVSLLTSFSLSLYHSLRHSPIEWTNVTYWFVI